MPSLTRSILTRLSQLQKCVLQPSSTYLSRRTIFSINTISDIARCSRSSLYELSSTINAAKGVFRSGAFRARKELRQTCRLAETASFDIVSLICRHAFYGIFSQISISPSCLSTCSDVLNLINDSRSVAFQDDFGLLEEPFKILCTLCLSISCMTECITP